MRKTLGFLGVALLLMTSCGRLESNTEVRSVSGPTIGSPRTLQARVTLPYGSFIEDPPGNVVPAISSEQALAIAKVATDPEVTSATPVLVLWTDVNQRPLLPDGTEGPPTYDHVLAWDIQETGCFPPPVPPPAPGKTPNVSPCNKEQHAVVDATTGELFGKLSF